MLAQNVQSIKGIGTKSAAELKRLRINTVKDLLYHVPRDYHDRSIITKINKINFTDTVNLIVRIRGKREKKFVKKMMAILIVDDDTGLAELQFFQQPYILKQYNIGDNLLISGKAELEDGKIILKNPEIEKLDDKKIHQIKPVYPSIASLKQGFWSKAMQEVLQNLEIEDYLPSETREKFNLPFYGEALHDIHFPKTMVKKERARKRLAFDEFLLWQLDMLERKGNVEKEARVSQYSLKCEIKNKILESLPFELTKAQKRVIGEVENDLQKNKVMNRLLQGDVGAGKTLVAALSLSHALESGYQAAMMAPTEILARQHYHNLVKLFQLFNFKVVLLTGGLKKKEKEKALESIASGEADLIIGTHALIQERVEFAALRFVVIDEQHRFGVLQRLSLAMKGAKPDVLIMTATPIPRTLSLTLYGDLDVSVLDEVPPGRQKIVTKAVEEKERKAMYSFIREKLEEGRQVYFVCPLIEESEKLSLQAAKDLQEQLDDIFSDYTVALLHGKMKDKEKEEIMLGFRDQEIDILVATTVIEVGIDVSNANIMVIESSERFGLSQLHQLRGRVGRGSEQSYCFLCHQKDNQRLKVMTETNDGFMIAEKDLEIRGPGEFLGVRQHGFASFKIASLATDQRILQAARTEAELLLKDDALSKYPLLRKEVDSLRKRYFQAENSNS